MGLILITHDLRVAFSICDRIYVLYAGSVLEAGAAAALEREPLHPYTLGLLLSEPPATVASPSSPRSPARSPSRTRSPSPARSRLVAAGRRAMCRDGEPPLRSRSARPARACVRIDEIRAELAMPRGSRRKRNVRAHVEVGRRVAEPLVRGRGAGEGVRDGRRGGEAVRPRTASRSRSARARASGSWANRARERRRSRAASSASRRRRPGSDRRSTGSTPPTTEGSSEDDRRRCGGRPDDLPGSVLVLEPGAHGRRDAARGARR